MTEITDLLTRLRLQGEQDKLDALAARFWSKVDKSGECWVWGGRQGNGYGTFDLTRSPVRVRVQASRFAYLLLYGTCPTKITYLCGNHLCVKPSHLVAARGRLYKSVEDRFWSKVDKDSESGCWNYSGIMFYQGSGMYPTSPQRMMYKLLYGTINNHMVVRKCPKNKHCVNPSHLLVVARKAMCIELFLIARMRRERSLLYDAETLRMLMNHTGDGCAFPRCENNRNQKRPNLWNVCKLHKRRIWASLGARRRRYRKTIQGGIS